MKKLPEIMPEYTITKLDKAPFSVKWEELMGWFIVPKLGEKLNWAMYDFPAKKRTEYVEMQVMGKAEIHGIEGVEIIATEHCSDGVINRSFPNCMGFRAVKQTSCSWRRHFDSGIGDHGTFDLGLWYPWVF